MSRREAEDALRELEGQARKGRGPDHHQARRLLLSLGRLLEELGTGACAPLLERARALSSPAWVAAVQMELSLACVEFARSVEPRYLELPNYDLAYTQGARVRLGDRLRAGRELGIDLDPREAAILELADRVLAAYLEKKQAGSRSIHGPDGDPPRN